MIKFAFEISWPEDRFRGKTKDKETLGNSSGNPFERMKAFAQW